MQKIRNPKNWWPLAVVILCGVVIGFQNCSNVGFSNGNGVNAFGGIIPDTPDAPAHFPPLNPTKPLCTQISQNIQPKLMWDWYSQLGASDFHDFNQIMAAPAVADLNNDGHPKVVVVSGANIPSDWYDYPANQSAWHSHNGVLRIIDGATGANLVSVGSQALAPYAATTPLLVDLDSDGKWEIIYVYYDLSKIIALNHDGTFRWSFTLPSPGGNCFMGLSTADFDLNGKAEVLAFGYVLEEVAGQPTVKMNFNSTVSGSDPACFGFASVIDPTNPHFSYVGPHAVQDNTGKKMYDLDGGSIMAVGKVRSDLQGNQVVGVGNQHLRVWDGNSGALLTDKDLLSLSQFTCKDASGNPIIGGGPPSIGDFVGDGTFQIAVATGQYIMIFDGKGNLLGNSRTQDCSSLSTAVTSFDFDGDGKPEILYGDENYFRIYHLVNGQLNVVAQLVNPSGTLNEFPVVADINGDGSAKLLVVANNYVAPGIYYEPSAVADGITAEGITGIRAFKSADGLPWMPTRHTFNQYHFNASLVNEVGRVFDPAEASQSWLGKTFRLNAQVTMTQPICQK